jgi:CheY-like chemotaxis protein
VDDELAVQKLLTYPLRKEGYDVIPALDGREALERLR